MILSIKKVSLKSIYSKQIIEGIMKLALFFLIIPFYILPQEVNPSESVASKNFDNDQQLLSKDSLRTGQYILTLKDSDLKESAAFVTKTLAIIPAGTLLKWIEYSEFGYWMVSYDGQEGFINEILVDCSDAALHYEGKLTEIFTGLRQKQDSIEANTKWLDEFRVLVFSESSKESLPFDILYIGAKIYLQKIENTWCNILYDNPELVKHRFDDEKSFEKSYIAGWIQNPKFNDSFVPTLSKSEIRRQEFILDNPKLKKKFKDAISEGSVILGMTKAMVTASVGYPDDINRTVGSWGVHEQWIYSSYYLYFENGVLTSWQD